MEDFPPDTPEDPPARTSLAPSDRRRSSLLSRPSLVPGDLSLDAIPETQQEPTQEPPAPIASTSSSPPARVDAIQDPFATTHSASFSATYATSTQPGPAPNSLSRQLFRPPTAPVGYKHPHFVPGYNAESPEMGRRMSTATTAYDGEADETANYGSYAQSLGRKSEAFSDLGRVSIGGQSEAYFAG